MSDLDVYVPDDDGVDVLIAEDDFEIVTRESSPIDIVIEAVTVNELAEVEAALATIDSSVTAAETAATNAAASAAAAATAETNAETAETNAETAATNAASSASAAATSETNAETAETNAETAATNAASSASAAATSETNAETAATSAASSASAAAGSASDAADSAAEAASYAAGLNLPPIVGGDAGKSLVVNGTEDGYEHVAAAGDVAGPASSGAGNAPVFADTTGKVLADSGSPPFSGDYDDLSNKPTLGDAAAKNTGTTAGTVAAGDHTHADAVASGASGFLSGTDKAKLDGVEASADVTDATNVGAAVHGASAKTTPVDADTIALIDSEASNALKKLSWANVKATLGSTFAALAGSISQAFAVLQLEVGHASDTTVTRSAAGRIAVEGVPLNPEIPVSDKSAAYTAVIADQNTCIRHPASDDNARTFTIPANASVAYPIGTFLMFINEVNTVTIAITSDTLVLAGAGSTGSRTLAANGIATAIKVAATRWYISGTGLT